MEMISALLIEGKCLLFVTNVCNLGLNGLWLLLDVQITMVTQRAFFLPWLARKLQLLPNGDFDVVITLSTLDGIFGMWSTWAYP